MTAEREAQLRASENLGYKMAREVFDELDATRADLAELLAAIPDCGDCGRPSTRTCHGELFYCDNPEHGWDGLEETEWAPIVRRLQNKGEISVSARLPFIDLLRWLQEEWNATEAWFDPNEPRLYITRWNGDRAHSFGPREARKWAQGWRK